MLHPEGVLYFTHGLWVTHPELVMDKAKLVSFTPKVIIIFGSKLEVMFRSKLHVMFGAKFDVIFGSTRSNIYILLIKNI